MTAAIVDLVTPAPAGAFANFLPRSAPEINGNDVHCLLLSRDDLFVRAQTLLAHPSVASDNDGIAVHSAPGPIALFRLAPRLAVSFNCELVQPAHMQCLLQAMRGRGYTTIPTARPNSPLVPAVIDKTCEFTLWSTGVPVVSAEEVSQLWREILTGGTVGEFEGLTTPKLYGSKERLTNFLHGVCVATLPEGSPILDMMAGTGIVSRTLAARHTVFANDVNPYASLLTRSQGISVSPHEIPGVIRDLMPRFMSNQEQVLAQITDAAARESGFLHGELNERVLEAYSQFCQVSVLRVNEMPASSRRAQTLFTERYANAYFGISQCVEIDSLRAAIETEFPQEEPRRYLCLAALIVAVCICNSAPHFAQPPKLESLKALRVIIERRARSILWEFELALKRLAARPPLRRPLQQVTSLDWPAALDAFFAAVPSGPRAIYLDPPYSKLQYSRYYHVLNVLLAYNYPPIIGVGRYTPLNQRFSSRFEYQPDVAGREINRIFARCADTRTTVMLSYGDRGFLKIPFLIESMSKYLGRVDIYSETLRHHSQGVRLSAPEKLVNEYVLVGGIN